MNFNPISKAIFDGLLSAYQNHKKLGEEGKTKDKENRFGDMALRGDVEAEEHILYSLKNLSERENYRIICKSEELGENELNPEGTKDFFAVFDGLDGSSNYLKGGEFGYGTMVAVASGENPKYEDFVVAGEAMMEEGKIILAVKNEGVFVYDVAKEEFTNLSKFKNDEVFSDSKTLGNKYFPEEIKAYGDKPWIMTGSTAWSIFSMCTDSRFNGLIEATRKKNLEQPVLYLMITELGGVMVDENGKSIGPNDFKTWGQSRDGEEFLVTAKNRGITLAIVERLDTPLK